MEDQNLLETFAGDVHGPAGQEAFTALVKRYLNLVYSAARRQVQSPQLAEEVCQTVFTRLACHAAKLKRDTVLTAWLYQVTRRAAIDTVRQEARRQAREQIALQMRDMNDEAVTWTQIEPLLDEAMESLEASDRTAILLRYFENKSLREVGEALGASEDAAQKRVSRALERLRQFLSKRKVSVGAGALAVLLSAHAVEAAPATLAGTVSGGAVLTAATFSSSTAIPVTKIITMTSMQKITAATAALLAGAVAIVGHQALKLHEQVQQLTQQQQDQAALVEQAHMWQRELNRATNELAALSEENASLKTNANPVLKLRNEVGRLQREKAELGATSALSKVTADPATRKAFRGGQKMGMAMIYKGFAQLAKLSPDQTEKFNDLLADHVMDNVDLITRVLRDKPAPEQMNQLFADQNAALLDKLQALLGPDGAAQYQDYSKNLLGTLTADQFKSQMTGTDEAKDEKAKQLSQLIQQQAQSALGSSGLPADYQTVPILNFVNIASEQQCERNLQVLQSIFENTAADAGSFLSPDELSKFQNFTSNAIPMNRTALSMNRNLMAPLAQ